MRSQFRLALILITLLVISSPATAALSASRKITASPAYNDIYVNSRPYNMDAYNIAGYTYYKLRSLAHSSNVWVWYDNASDCVNIDTEKPYDQNYAADASSISNQNGSQTAVPTKSNIMVNGKPVHIESYLINNYNYFKLRDFANNTNLSVQYDELTKTIYLGTGRSIPSNKTQYIDQLNRDVLWNEVTYTEANNLFYSGNSDLVFVYYSHEKNNSNDLIQLYRESAEQSNIKVYALDKSSPRNASGSDDFFGNRYSSGNDISLPTIYVVNDSQVEIYDNIQTESVIVNFFSYLSSGELSSSNEQTVKPEPTAIPVITDTPTITNTPSPSYTPTPTAIITISPTAAFSPSPAATISLKPTKTIAPKPTVTFTPKPTAAFTPKPSPTNSPKPTATPQPAVSSSPTPIISSSTSANQYINRVIELVNNERSAAGLSTLTPDARLMEAAMYKCTNMSDTGVFSHVSPTYGEAYVLMDLFKIKYAAWGENIAAGQKTPEDVVAAWMDSPGHRKNIMKSEYTNIGVGYLNDKKYGTLWAQEFIKKP